MYLLTCALIEDLNQPCKICPVNAQADLNLHCVHISEGRFSDVAAHIDGYQALRLINIFSCSTQLSMKFFMLINLDLLTITNSFLLNIAEHDIFSANK